MLVDRHHVTRQLIQTILSILKSQGVADLGYQLMYGRWLGDEIIRAIFQGLG
jgi:hypothetical protein